MRAAIGWWIASAAGFLGHLVLSLSESVPPGVLFAWFLLTSVAFAFFARATSALPSAAATLASIGALALGLVALAAAMLPPDPAVLLFYLRIGPVLALARLLFLLGGGVSLVAHGILLRRPGSQRGRGSSQRLGPSAAVLAATLLVGMSLASDGSGHVPAISFEEAERPVVRPPHVPPIEHVELLQPFEPRVFRLDPEEGLSEPRRQASTTGRPFLLAMRSADGSIAVATRPGGEAEGDLRLRAPLDVVVLVGPDDSVRMTLKGVRTRDGAYPPATTLQHDLQAGDTLPVRATDLLVRLESKGVGTFTLLDPVGIQRARLGFGEAHHVALDRPGAWRIGCDGVCVGSVVATLHGYDPR